jgi:single-strand DNA-binding protein
MQKISFIGRLTRDVDMKTTPNGIAVASFTVAVDRKQKDTDGNKKVDFFNVNVWRGLADICSRYLSKGKKCYVRGELQVRTYSAKDGTTKVSLDVQADEVEFLSPKSESSEEQPSTDANGFTDVSPDSIPF